MKFTDDRLGRWQKGKLGNLWDWKKVKLIDTFIYFFYLLIREREGERETLSCCPTYYMYFLVVSCMCPDQG